MGAQATLEHIYRLFSDKTAIKDKSRSELLDQSRRAFMLGLRCRDPALRAKFTELFHSTTHQTIPQRLDRIFSSSDWQHLFDTFWLTQALDLLVANIADQDALQCSPTMGKVPSITHVVAFRGMLNVPLNASHRGGANVALPLPVAAGGAAPMQIDQAVPSGDDDADRLRKSRALLEAHQVALKQWAALKVTLLQYSHRRLTSV